MPLYLLAVGAQAQVIQVLHVFDTYTESGEPQTALIQAADGNFFGMTYATVFRLTTNGEFTPIFALLNGTEKLNWPYGPLIQTSDGTFYGTASRGGMTGYGGIFKLTTNGLLTTIASFNRTNGSYPRGGLVQGDDGNFYGTTYNGGANNLGTVYRVTSTGVLTTLISFDNTNGARPYGELVKGDDGSFYGTTSGGDYYSNTPTNFGGTVFKMTTDGVLTTLFSFGGTNNGAFPHAGLSKGNDGNLYGTAYMDGPHQQGTVFMITPNGVQTVLGSFGYTNNFGVLPEAAVIKGSDGRFYGTTSAGGQYGNGVIFQTSSNGVMSTVVSFLGSQGAAPKAALIQGRDGNFYGVASQGGNSWGTIFRVVMPVAVREKSIDGNVVVSWTTNYPGYRLQSSPSVTPPLWTDVTNTPSVVGTEYVITNSGSASAQFFRLTQ